MHGGKMMMLLENILYQSKIDLQSLEDFTCFSCTSREFLLFPKFFAFSTRTTTYVCCIGRDIYIPICFRDKAGQRFCGVRESKRMKVFVNLRIIWILFYKKFTLTNGMKISFSRKCFKKVCHNIERTPISVFLFQQRHCLNIVACTGNVGRGTVSGIGLMRCEMGDWARKIEFLWKVVV
jgi:hypothetical protein